MRVTTYRNNRNPHKFLDVKHTADRHYMWRQRIVFDNGVANHVSTLKGGFHRQSKGTIDEVLLDYKEC